MYLRIIITTIIGSGRAFDAKAAIDGFSAEDIRKQFFYPNINTGSTFFDIGTCHGSWALPALANGAYVYAFEPDPRYNESP